MVELQPSYSVGDSHQIHEKLQKTTTFLEILQHFLDFSQVVWETNIFIKIYGFQLIIPLIETLF